MELPFRDGLNISAVYQTQGATLHIMKKHIFFAMALVAGSAGMVSCTAHPDNAQASFDTVANGMGGTGIQASTATALDCIEGYTLTMITSNGETELENTGFYGNIYDRTWYYAVYEKTGRSTATYLYQMENRTGGICKVRFDLTFTSPTSGTYTSRVISGKHTATKSTTKGCFRFTKDTPA